MSQYQAFIEDPKHRAELDRQRFVVLRMPPIVTRAFDHVQDAVRGRLPAQPVSYPTRAHVTLCGFAAGTSLDDVRELVTIWSQETPVLSIEVERTGAFPPPFQILMLQVRRTPELAAALSTLRGAAERRGMTLSTRVPARDWIFHITVAYCSGLTAGAWQDIERFVQTLHVQPAACVVANAEVVAFDSGREYSGGVFALNQRT